MKVAVPLWLVVVTVIAYALLLLILWSVKRRNTAHIRLMHADDSNALMKSIAGFTQGTVLGGNAIRVIHNGRFFDELLADVGRATKSISLETFLAKEGDVTRRLADALARKAREGVEVRVTLDGRGGRKFGKEALSQMRDAGCGVAHYRPIRLRNLGLINQRTHRKIAVIDGRIGYVGGHCLVDNWLGDAEDKKHFRDISARIEGPVVAQLQSAFTDNWMEETGEVAGGAGLFPPLEPAGDVSAHVVYVSPKGNASTIKMLHYAAVQTAQKRLLVQNPYFLPDPDARDLLAATARRGVDVRIMLPAASATDAPVVQHASHHHYGTLLKAGIRIFEYERTLLHQKVLSVDGKWAVIGSSNFDDRSFEINHEVAVVAYDESVASELEQAFERDLAHCVEMNLHDWQRRPILHKLLDGTTFLFNEQL